MAKAELTIFTADEWAERLVKLYPNRWTGDAAKLAGGIMYKMFAAPSSQMEFLENNLDWVLNACRIATAEDEALDAFAVDYFGAVKPFTQAVKRQPGEPDESFRDRIYANLLAPGGTRADITRVLELMTGKKPRIIEPWNAWDCACADAASYCDIDVVGNSGRVGDLGMEGQLFVESIMPSFADQGNNPVYCADAGACTDRSFVLDPKPTWFMGEKELDMAINRVRMGGIIAWRSYGTKLVADYVRGNTNLIGVEEWRSDVTLFPECSQALVVLASAAWNSRVSVVTHNRRNFEINLSVAAPGGQGVDWIAAPVTKPGYGLLPITEAASGASLLIPKPGQVLLVTPNWNTGVWVTEMENTQASFAFDTPAPVGAVLNYGTFQSAYSGIEVVTPDALDAYVYFNVDVPLPYQLILLPGWNTQFQFQKSKLGFSVKFSTPPEAGAFFYWGVLSQPY